MTEFLSRHTVNHYPDNEELKYRQASPSLNIWPKGFFRENFIVASIFNYIETIKPFKLVVHHSEKLRKNSIITQWSYFYHPIFKIMP